MHICGEASILGMILRYFRPQVLEEIHAGCYCSSNYIPVYRYVPGTGTPEDPLSFLNTGTGSLLADLV